MDDNTNSRESTKRSEGPFAAYTVIAFVSAIGSAGVAFVVFVLAFSNLNSGGIQTLSTAGFWALSSTVFAPAVMGIGVCYWVHKTNCARLNAQNNTSRGLDPKVQFGIKE